MQSSEASCGPCSVSNALKTLDLDISEKDVSGWLEKVRRKDSPGAEGTTEDLLLRAVTEGAPKKYRLGARGWKTTDAAVAIPALRGLLLEGNVAVLAVDGDEHWVSAIGINGRRLLIVDSGDPKAEITLSYTPEALRARWEVPGDPASFYALILWQEGRR